MGMEWTEGQSLGSTRNEETESPTVPGRQCRSNSAPVGSDPLSSGCCGQMCRRGGTWRGCWVSVCPSEWTLSASGSGFAVWREKP